VVRLLRFQSLVHVVKDIHLLMDSKQADELLSWLINTREFQL
jgi:hypothetical protein